MEKFKDKVDIFNADPRMELFVSFDRKTGEKIGQSAELMHDRLSPYLINASCPEEVHTSFNTAKNLILYSWFCYGFSPVASMHLYGTLELALREKAKYDGVVDWENLGLSALLKIAVNRKWIVDDKFYSVRQREAAREEVMARSGDVFQPYTKDDMQYCRILMDTVPYLRNRLAHGHGTVYPFSWSIHLLGTVTDLINQLFPENKTEVG